MVAFFFNSLLSDYSLTAENITSEPPPQHLFTIVLVLYFKQFTSLKKNTGPSFEATRQVKALTAKPKALSLIPGVNEKTDAGKLFSDFHKCAPATPASRSHKRVNK